MESTGEVFTFRLANLFQVLEKLRDRLISKIQNEMDESLLHNLLEKCFPYVSFSQLRPVIFSILGKFQQIPAVFLASLWSDPLLYDECTIEIKRQIWVQNLSLFRQVVVEIFSEYIQSERTTSLSHDMSNHNPTPPKRRRMNPHITKIAGFVGSSIVLYNHVLAFLR
eukprot:Sdes_comp12826_c0_seq2m3020